MYRVPIVTAHGGYVASRAGISQTVRFPKAQDQQPHPRVIMKRQSSNTNTKSSCLCLGILLLSLLRRCLLRFCCCLLWCRLLRSWCFSLGDATGLGLTKRNRGLVCNGWGLGGRGLLAGVGLWLSSLLGGWLSLLLSSLLWLGGSLL